MSVKQFHLDDIPVIFSRESWLNLMDYLSLPINSLKYNEI